jgi:GNAT superfamily N-acetyltransferase
MAISLRVATVADASLLSELGARLFEQTFAKDNTPEDMAGYLKSAFNPAQQMAELAEPRNLFFMASAEDGSVVGYAMLIRSSRTSTVEAADPAEINRIYIDRTLHGSGAGAALMSACIEQARAWNADALWLAVWEKNPRAIAFYEKSGFRQVGRKTFQLGSDLQHDFVMVRNLSS